MELTTIHLCLYVGVGGGGVGRNIEVPVKLAHYTEGFHGMICFFDGPIPFDVGHQAMNDLVEYLKENI